MKRVAAAWIALSFAFLTAMAPADAGKKDGVDNYELRVLSARMSRYGGPIHIVFKMYNRFGGDATPEFFDLRHKKSWRVCSKLSIGKHSQDSMWNVGGYISGQDGLVLAIDQNNVPNQNGMRVSLTFMDEWGNEHHVREVTIDRI